MIMIIILLKEEKKKKTRVWWTKYDIRCNQRDLKKKKNPWVSLDTWLEGIQKKIVTFVLLFIQFWTHDYQSPIYPYTWVNYGLLALLPIDNHVLCISHEPFSFFKSAWYHMTYLCFRALLQHSIGQFCGFWRNHLCWLAVLERGHVCWLTPSPIGIIVSL